eukprot:4357386-Prymnesium_polylepis.1
MPWAPVGCVRMRCAAGQVSRTSHAHVRIEIDLAEAETPKSWDAAPRDRPRARYAAPCNDTPAAPPPQSSWSHPRSRPVA